MTRSGAKKVVLFDIDGTLLLSHGAGRRAMEQALREVFGSHGPPSYRYDGKTDKLIVRETMRADGHDDGAIDARMDDVIARYLDGLRANLAEGGRAGRGAYALPGILPLLDAVEAHDELVLGLLTGNVVDGANAKLGAFGSDHEERPMLPPIARARASELLGAELPGERLLIIGDTPADVHCGQGVGARAIAVATGGYSVDELAACGPCATFADLAETGRVMQAILDA
jgi:phosphoglycolate phosphatase